MRKSTIPLALLFAATLTCSGCGDSGAKIALDEYVGLPEIRLASLYAREEKGNVKLKMKAPFTDTYTVSFPSNSGTVTVYDADGKRLANSVKELELSLKKNDIVYLNINPEKPNINMEVKAKENDSPLPFDPINVPDVNSFDVNGDPNVDPLQEARLEYKKREGTLYVYSNAPETLKPEILNKALTRNDISDQEVFFTFEHQSDEVKAYYGYQVRNTGTEDMYVTVKNIGYQLAGDGAYLGEMEWTSFYNTKFALPDMSKWTESQEKSFKAWFNLGGKYANPKFQSVTYRIPAGKYMYVIGGTREDSFNNYAVLKGGQPDALNYGSCQNGAVLFEVKGKAEGAFYAYTDPKAIEGDTTSHVGFFFDGERCHVGVDEGACVDASAVWTFNDKTPAQDLPVTYTNYYKDYPAGSSPTGEPFSKIDSTPHEKHLKTWYTHSNVQNYHDSVGTDMTTFHSVSNGKPVVTGNDYYDINGDHSNIGNWMKDYIDTFTFVNQGDRDRTVTVTLYPMNGGGVVAMARDQDGNRIEGTPYTSLIMGKTVHGDAIHEPFQYTATVKAHSVLQFHVEYNLMANSYGTLLHGVKLN